MSDPEQHTHLPATAPEPEPAVPDPNATPVPTMPACAAPGDPAAAVQPRGSHWARLSRGTALALGVGIGAAGVGACWLSVSLLGGDEVKVRSGSPSSTATADATPSPEPFGTDGTITLATVGAGLDTGGLCSGTGGYSDIDFGTQVNITDAAGTLVATGSLDFGETTEAGCTFAFKVDDITPGTKFYTVEVSHRGGLTKTEAELRAGGLEFTLGS